MFHRQLFLFFSQADKLPKGLEIFDFVNTVSKDGTYNMLIVNNSLESVSIPRATHLGSIEVVGSQNGTAGMEGMGGMEETRRQDETR
jgi:hypothetical protein